MAKGPLKKRVYLKLAVLLVAFFNYEADVSEKVWNRNAIDPAGQRILGLKNTKKT